MSFDAMQLDGQFANECFTGCWLCANESDEQDVCPCGNADCKQFSFRSSLAQTAEAGIAGAAERQSGTQPLPANNRQSVKDAVTGEF